MKHLCMDLNLVYKAPTEQMTLQLLDKRDAKLGKLYPQAIVQGICHEV